MRWMITGAGGMLGTDLTELLRTTPGMRVRPFTRSELDLRDAGAVAWAVRAARPDVVVNCAAWTAVDDAETREEEALAINGTAVSVLARVAADLGARLIQLSTDYVFDGAGDRPYGESAADGPHQRLRQDQARGRARGPGARPPRGAYGLALRRPRPQLRPHDGRPRSLPADRLRGRRPVRPAHLDR